MAWKQTGQQSLADQLVSHHKCLEELDDLHGLIDWQCIEQRLLNVHNSTKGNESFHPVVMFKVLLLQKLYTLSDPKMEKQLARDLMFRRFVGLSLSDDTPDHSTIWRFHKLLGEEGLIEELFAEINSQLTEKNVIINTGSVSIIDASVVEAKNTRPKKSKNDANVSSQDKEASYSVKKDSNGHLKTIFGFKMHVNADEDGFIKKVKTTTGSVHDSNCLEDLLTDDETAVYADSAYKSAKHDNLLNEKQIDNEIHERGYRNRSLTEEQKVKNMIKSQTRNTVERVFGHLKRHYGMTKARHLGLLQFNTNTLLASIAHNLKTAVSIKQKYGIVTG